MSPDLLAVPLRLLRSAAAIALRVVATLVGFAFMLGMVLLGLAAGTVLLVWTLLRGGRPVFRFRGMPPRGAWRAPAPPPGDVVDIEAREIEPPGRP